MKIIIGLLALIGIAIGMASMITPIPGGTLLIALCLSTLIYISVTAQTSIKWLRLKLNWFDQIFIWLSGAVGSRVRFIGVALAKTDPARDFNRDN